MDRIIKKALKSSCRYKIAAVGFDQDGRVIAYANNRPRFKKHGGGVHAEMALMLRYGGPKAPKNRRVLSRILIVRVNRHGVLRPLHPCSRCAEKANELGIKIVRSE